MTEVSLIDLEVSKILSIVAELKQSGLVPDIDFYFHYHPPKWDNFSSDAVYNRHTIFSFREESVATWFALKYDNNVQK